MRKLNLIAVLIVLILILTSCGFKDIDTNEKIISPNNNIPPISGQWKIDKYKRASSKGLSDEEVNKIIDKKALFHKKVVVIGDDIYLSPSYKLKNVNSLDYLLYQYKVNPDFLGIRNKKMQVISMSSEEQFYYEFIRETDDEMIVNIDGVFFHLTKISDELDDKEINSYIEKIAGKTKALSTKEDEILRSGIILGLRYYEEGESQNEEGEYKYRTIWICSKNKTVDKIYETENLFVPRKSGFWKIGVDRISIEENIKDIIYAYPANKKSDEMGFEEIPYEDNYNTKKQINYVGNNYMVVEITEGQNRAKSTLQVLPIDNIKNANPIKISDIAGESGKNAFYEGATRYFSTDSKFQNKYIDLKPTEENFGIVRRNGHWVMKGRINLNEENEKSYVDFNIKTITPKELVNYDELAISWNAVKMRVPQATDVYTSPNGDIAVVLTHNSLMVYAIENGELSQEPIKKIKLNSGEKVVMNEWATGKYIYIWEEEFLKNMVSIIDE
ncbi:MAG: Lipoprotein [Sporanaerobacter sp.]|jgi:hypothetical protein|uniref:hypothetical protein n=1 Tax=Sporanaerobacter sp. TaxID=2010183 RepID=UPI003A0FE23C